MTTAVDLADVARRATAALSERWPDHDLRSLAPLPGGASSLTYVADLAPGSAPATRVVVKMAPPGLAPVRNRDVLRQARILELLAPSEVAVPTVLGMDPGRPPAVPPLFVMSFVAGEAFEPTNGPGEPPPPATVSARAQVAARMLAQLHRVNVGGAQLAGERVYTLPEEVERWARAFATVEADLCPTAAAVCRERLLDRLPVAGRPAILHGDWRLGNMLCRDDDVAAVIDWEIWSLADPRIDLAWFLLMADPTRAPGLRAESGLPAPAELAALYEEAGGALVQELAWFHALVRYKQAAASALIVKHNRQSPVPDPRALSFADHIEPLLEGAVAHLARARRAAGAS